MKRKTIRSGKWRERYKDVQACGVELDVLLVAHDRGE